MPVQKSFQLSSCIGGARTDDSLPAMAEESDRVRREWSAMSHSIRKLVMSSVRTQVPQPHRSLGKEHKICGKGGSDEVGFTQL